MKKRYSDGSEVEGTPEEIERYDDIYFKSSPFKPNPWIRTPWGPATVESWPVGDQGMAQENMPCAIERFFRDNPDATSASIYCGCPRCNHYR